MATLNIAGTQTGTAGLKGVTAQYQREGIVGGDNANTNITPAGPYISKGTNNSIIGTVPPGKAGIPQISTVIQNSTDPLVVGPNPINVPTHGAVAQADNFLSAITSQVGSSVVAPAFSEGNVTPNAAQLASAGKSLSPEHE